MIKEEERRKKEGEKDGRGRRRK
jgi:hypothetical protein